MTRTRAEHLASAKARALEYLDAGHSELAGASMISDMGKHDKLRMDKAVQALCREFYQVLHTKGPDGVRAWIGRFA